MFKIIGMSLVTLSRIAPTSIDWLLAKEEFIYIAESSGAFWKYNYEVAKKGKAGLHTLLKSGLHSDGFFYSKILLELQNVRKIMARQLVMLFDQLGIVKPDWVIGIPDGATELGEEVAALLGVKYAVMKKVDSRIVLESSIAADETVLIIEDFCTKGTGLIETVIEILTKQPRAKILPYVLYLLNRGGLTEIEIPAEKTGDEKLILKVVPLVDHKINDWEPPVCPLCNDYDSEAIKPKATAESWEAITTSQQ